jgi:hypothetical protein
MWKGTLLHGFIVGLFPSKIWSNNTIEYVGCVFYHGITNGIFKHHTGPVQTTGRNVSEQNRLCVVNLIAFATGIS